MMIMANTEAATNLNFKIEPLHDDYFGEATECSFGHVTPYSF